MVLLPVPEPVQPRNAQLATRLRLWCSGDVDAGTQNSLLEFAFKVVTNVNSAQLKAAAVAQGVEARRLAVSAIAELFAVSGPESPLARSLAGYLDDDAAAIARFKATIITRATQFAHSQLEHNDPNGSRIMRNLRLAYKRDLRLQVGPVGELSHIALAEVENPQVAGKPWTIEELVTLVCKHAGCSGCIGDWLVLVLEEMASTPGRQRFARTTDLETAFRKADSLLAEGELLSRADHEPPNPEVRRAMANAITLVSHEGRARLDRFLDKGRLDPTAHNRLALALQDMIQDICQEGDGQLSRYEYVSRHWPNLDQETFRNLLKSPFQTAVEHVHNRLREILGGLRQ
jgi:hypothetical protein